MILFTVSFAYSRESLRVAIRIQSMICAVMARHSTRRTVDPYPRVEIHEVEIPAAAVGARMAWIVHA